MSGRGNGSYCCRDLAFVAAHHEAGHAVLAVLSRVPIVGASIERRIRNAAGHVSLRHPAWLSGAIKAGMERGVRLSAKHRSRRARIEGHLLVLWGGVVAERILRGRDTRVGWLSGRGDFDYALDLARLYVGNHEEAEAWVDTFERPAARIIRANWSAVQAVARELLMRKVLSGRSLQAIVSQHMRR